MGNALECMSLNRGSDDIILKVRTQKDMIGDENAANKVNLDNCNTSAIKEEKNDVALTLNQPQSKQTTYDSTASSPRSFRSLQLLKTNELNYAIKSLIILGDVDKIKDYIKDDVDIMNLIITMRFDFKNYCCCHVAVVKNNLPLLKYLIETIGCDASALDINNNNCINIAYQHRKIAIIGI